MKQLSEGQRYKIEAYLQAGMKKDEIARLVGIHRSTLYRELRRNKWKPTDKYKADYAQYRYELRKSQRERHTKFTIWIEERARVMLEELHYSPEQIVGRCRLLGYPMVSHERLYQWIWKINAMQEPCTGACAVREENTGKGKTAIRIGDGLKIEPLLPRDLQ